MSGTVPVVARVAAGTRARLAALIEGEKARRGALMPAALPLLGLDTAARAEARTRARQRLEQLRARGELLDTVDAALAHGVRLELTARGWNRAWPPVPASAPSSGRWPGSREAGWGERVPARLPVALAGRVQAACWHASAEAITTLRAWRETHPGRLIDPVLSARLLSVGMPTRPARRWGTAAVTRCSSNEGRPGGGPPPRPGRRSPARGRRRQTRRDLRPPPARGIHPHHRRWLENPPARQEHEPTARRVPDSGYWRISFPGRRLTAGRAGTCR
ncbi:hypothetical protein [Planobispora rosea]|uniref:hypothetical protein n=1 Tax=Planobispora rosea TaxID=35762 RepID=UPI00159F0267|nr:hypothetical protein [Planobispora rosea]